MYRLHIKRDRIGQWYIYDQGTASEMLWQYLKQNYRTSHGWKITHYVPD